MKIAYVYEDLGDPWYPDALKWFQASVRSVGASALHIQGQPPKDMKANFWRYWAYLRSTAGMQTDEDLVISDVDILWRKNPSDLFGDFDIGLMYRTYPLMPYNEGVLLTRPTTGAKRFWALYQAAIGLMPHWTWHSPQIAVATIVGEQMPGEICTVRHPIVGEIRVKVFDMKQIVPCPKEEGYDGPAYALHFKGPKRRHLMERYVSTGG